MKRLASSLALLAALSLAAAPAHAEKIVVGLGLSHSVADLATYDAGTGYSSAYDHSELGGRFEYWNFMKEHYALNFSANLGFFSETQKPGAAAPGGPEGKYSQSSYSVRLGGDRVWQPLPNVKYFIGPGVEYWVGKAKFEDLGGAVGTYETKNIVRASLHGHCGAMLAMGDNWGISGQLGHRIGLASYKEAGSKTSWMPSSIDGAFLVYFNLGGK